jgi:hypothetical protein
MRSGVPRPKRYVREVPPLIRRAIPWLFLLVAAFPALVVLYETVGVACGEMPGAFDRGVTTTPSETLEVVASHCEIERHSDGLTTKLTIVNWSGIVFAIGICVAAWFGGAAIGRVVDRRKCLLVVAVAGSAAFVALATFFG